jgi:hypothetical protein
MIATSKVPAAHFQAEHEDRAGFLRLMRAVAEGPGLPLARYRDQHATLQRKDAH